MSSTTLMLQYLFMDKEASPYHMVFLKANLLQLTQQQAWFLPPLIKCLYLIFIRQERIIQHKSSRIINDHPVLLITCVLDVTREQWSSRVCSILIRQSSFSSRCQQGHMLFISFQGTMCNLRCGVLAAPSVTHHRVALLTSFFF